MLTKVMICTQYVHNRLVIKWGLEINMACTFKKRPQVKGEIEEDGSSSSVFTATS